MFFQFLVGGVIFIIATIIPFLYSEGFKGDAHMSISSSGSHRFHYSNHVGHGGHIGHGSPIGHNRPLAVPLTHYGGGANYNQHAPYYVYAPYCSYEDYKRGLCLLEEVLVPLKA